MTRWIDTRAWRHRIAHWLRRQEMTQGLRIECAICLQWERTFLARLYRKERVTCQTSSS